MLQVRLHFNPYVVEAAEYDQVLPGEKCEKTKGKGQTNYCESLHAYVSTYYLIDLRSGDYLKSCFSYRWLSLELPYIFFLNSVRQYPNYFCTGYDEFHQLLQ